MEASGIFSDIKTHPILHPGRGPSSWFSAYASYVPSVHYLPQQEALRYMYLLPYPIAWKEDALQCPWDFIDVYLVSYDFLIRRVLK